LLDIRLHTIASTVVPLHPRPSPSPGPSARFFTGTTSLAAAFAAKVAASTPDPDESSASHMSETPASFYDLKAALPGDDKYYNFEQLKGKVVLIVNVASKWCAFSFASSFVVS
jgi:hypothetical protein